MGILNTKRVSLGILLGFSYKYPVQMEGLYGGEQPLFAEVDLLVF
jgi:hypothetical protein